VQLKLSDCRSEPMHLKPSLASTLVLLATAALMAAAGFPSRAGASRPANSPKTVTVEIRGFKFEPETVVVNQGDTVEWKNDDTVPHTATEDDNAQKPTFDSGAIQMGATWRYVTRNKGTYNYTCTFHPNMEGKLIVQ
jgi:plastocyanin